MSILKIIEEDFFYNFKWYRKYKGGHFQLVVVHGHKTWYRNHTGFNKDFVEQEEDW